MRFLLSHRTFALIAASAIAVACGSSTTNSTASTNTTDETGGTDDTTVKDSGVKKSTKKDAGKTTADAGDPFAEEATCTSGSTYTKGNNADMRPGQECVKCHSSDEGPIFTVAGTVYPTGHEPDGCFSNPPSGITVIITDSKGVEKTIPVSTKSGNFSTTAKLTPPFTAVVSDGEKTREMKRSVDVADCNSCHTQDGDTGAPGRIVLP